MSDHQHVLIQFDCLPLRSLERLDIPLDASPAYRARCERIQRAIQQHGTFNTYFLYNASCTFYLANHPQRGMLRFWFEGTVLTDPTDRKTERADLEVELVAETCDWLIEPVVRWMHRTVHEAVKIEFDRYIAAGDLGKAQQRAQQIETEADKAGGYIGMGL